MSVESRLTIVEEKLRLLRDANRLQGRRVSAEAPTNNYYLGWDGTSKKWEPKGLALVRKTANETVNNNNTLQDDDDLLFALAANETWLFEAFISFNTQTAADIQFAFTIPSGATMRWAASKLGPSTPAQGSEEVYDVEITSGTPIAVAVQDTSFYAVHIMGTVVNNSTAGNLQLQWAQNAAHASTTTVYINSWLRASQV